MAVYALYGFLSDDIDEVRNLLKTSLGIQFEIRDSDYQGGEYYKSLKHQHIGWVKDYYSMNLAIEKLSRAVYFKEYQ